jgi:hypothetical protein
MDAEAFYEKAVKSADAGTDQQSQDDGGQQQSGAAVHHIGDHNCDQAQQLADRQINKAGRNDECLPDCQQGQSGRLVQHIDEVLGRPELRHGQRDAADQRQGDEDARPAANVLQCHSLPRCSRSLRA